MFNKENLTLLIEYNESEIKVLIREAFKGLLLVYTIDNENKFFLLPLVKLQEIYTNHPTKVEVIFRSPTRNNHQIQDFGSWRRIAMSDLVLDKTIADNILSKNSESMIQESLKPEESLIDNVEEETVKDRDARLIKRAAELTKTQSTIKGIQKQLLKEENNNSKVQMPTLRKIITKNAIKKARAQLCENAIL